MARKQIKVKTVNTWLESEALKDRPRVAGRMLTVLGKSLQPESIVKLARLNPRVALANCEELLDDETKRYCTIWVRTPLSKLLTKTDLVDYDYRSEREKIR